MEIKSDIAVVGGGPAGMTAALYALRAGKSVTLFEHSGLGGQIALAPKIDNFPALPGITGREISQKMAAQIKELGAVVVSERVEELITGETKTIKTDRGSYGFRSVIIAAGQKHKRLGLLREDELTGCGVSYCAVCDGAFFKGERVAVTGGGNSALQEALFLSAFCAEVYLIHRRPEFRGDACLVRQLEKKPNVKLFMESRVTALNGDGELSSVTLQRGADSQNLSVSALFVAVGQEPDNTAFRNAADLDEQGYIIAGEDTKTKIPGVFAAGDCRTKRVRQLTTAASDGAVAALAACEYIDSL